MTAANGRHFTVVEGQKVPLDRIARRRADRSLLEQGARVLRKRLAVKSQTALPPSERFVEVSLADGWIRFSGVAGRVRLARWTVDVKPKFMAAGEWDRRWTSIVARAMLVTPRHLVVLPETVQGLSPRSNLVEPVALWFVNSVEEALRRGPIRAYTRVLEQPRHIRGRLIVSQYLVNFPQKIHQFPCSFTKMKRDNEWTRLLSWTSDTLARVVSDHSLRRRLRSVAERLGRPRSPSE